MMKRLLIPTTIVAMAISACGGPDIDKVKADFENPSGSAKDKNAVIAANGKQNTAGNSSALSLAGGGVPGLGLGSSAFTKIATKTIVARQIASIAQIGLHKSELRAQAASPACFQSSDATQASQDLAEAFMTGGSASASYSISVNLADCDVGASGSMEMSIDMKVDGQTISYDSEVTMNNVCEEATGSCVDGGMAQQGAIDLGSADMSNIFGSIKLVSAWDFTATFKDAAGKDQSIKSKGGLRIGYSSDANGESGKIEYLEYVTDASGNEVSYVLIIEANSNGDATLKIKCKDGELSCMFSESMGSGSCNGTIDGESFMVDWTSDDYNSVVDSDDFKG
jgi:hypothetical protein